MQRAGPVDIELGTHASPDGDFDRRHRACASRCSATLQSRGLAWGLRQFSRINLIAVVFFTARRKSSRLDRLCQGREAGLPCRFC